MKNDQCSHKYEKNCECREDNNCGCTYPNNMHNDFMCSNIHITENSSEVADDAEYAFNQETGEGVYICPACKETAKDCSCHKE